MLFSRFGRTAGIVFVIFGVAIAFAPALKLYRRAVGEATAPFVFDSVDGVLLGLGLVLILLCLYLLLRPGKQS